MSIFLMSDIHGELRRFLKALEVIKFDKDKDIIYILGDVVDRGEDGIELLRYIMSNQESIHLILGNHEMFLRRYLSGGRFGEKNLSRALYETYHYGGIPTARDTDLLKQKEKDEIIDFLYRLPLYEVIDAPNGKVVLTHTGLDVEHIIYEETGKVSVIKSICEGYRADSSQYMVSTDIHHMPAILLKKLNYPMVVGHFPCRYLNEDKSNRIYHGINYVCIDGGCGYPEDKGELAIYRVEDGEEWYI